MRNPNSKTPKTELYDSWQQWAQQSHEYVLPRPRFYEALDARGFGRVTQSGTRCYRGLAVKQPDLYRQK